MSCVYLPYREQTSQVRPQTAPPTWPVQNQTRSRLCSNNSESPWQPFWLVCFLSVCHCSTFLFPHLSYFPISHPYLCPFLLFRLELAISPSFSLPLYNNSLYRWSLIIVTYCFNSSPTVIDYFKSLCGAILLIA